MVPKLQNVIYKGIFLATFFQVTFAMWKNCPPELLKVINGLQEEIVDGLKRFPTGRGLLEAAEKTKLSTFARSYFEYEQNNRITAVLFSNEGANISRIHDTPVVDEGVAVVLLGRYNNGVTDVWALHRILVVLNGDLSSAIHNIDELFDQPKLKQFNLKELANGEWVTGRPIALNETHIQRIQAEIVGFNVAREDTVEVVAYYKGKRLLSNSSGELSTDTSSPKRKGLTNSLQNLFAKKEKQPEVQLIACIAKVNLKGRVTHLPTVIIDGEKKNSGIIVVADPKFFVATEAFAKERGTKHQCHLPDWKQSIPQDISKFDDIVKNHLVYENLGLAIDDINLIPAGYGTILEVNSYYSSDVPTSIHFVLYQFSNKRKPKAKKLAEFFYTAIIETYTRGGPGFQVICRGKVKLEEWGARAESDTFYTKFVLWDRLPKILRAEPDVASRVETGLADPANRAKLLPAPAKLSSESAGKPSEPAVIKKEPQLQVLRLYQSNFPSEQYSGLAMCEAKNVDLQFYEVIVQDNGEAKVVYVVSVVVDSSETILIFASTLNLLISNQGPHYYHAPEQQAKLNWVGDIPQSWKKNAGIKAVIGLTPDAGLRFLAQCKLRGYLYKEYDTVGDAEIDLFELLQDAKFGIRGEGQPNEQWFVVATLVSKLETKYLALPLANDFQMALFHDEPLALQYAELCY